MTATPGAASRSWSTTSSAPETCSRLSRTISAERGATDVRKRAGWRSRGGTSSVSATVVHITAAVVTAAKGTKCTPSANRGTSWSATAIASRVFPDPRAR